MKRIILNMKTITSWKRLFTIPVVTALFILGAAAGPAFAAAGGGCPNSKDLKDFVTASNVGAVFSDAGTTTTYTFFSLTNENPVNGVPGLIKYCVYPSPAGQPNDIDVEAVGANGDPWAFDTGSRNFSFVRPAGTKSDIPLDGTSTVMGTATWATLPIDQTILLHIIDPTVCANLYGGTSPTCFVKPGQSCACNAGDTTVAYNAMPFNAVNCAKESFGVEAYNFNEIGDEVTLEAGTGRTLVSLNVLFASYGCSDSGHWYTGDCVTTPGATFTHEITANIYSVKNSGCPVTPPCPDEKLATVTQTFTIPFRPSHDSVNCPDAVSGAAAGSQWFNPLANSCAGGCQFSISKVLTFDFSSLNITLPDTVIWTVAYNTSNSGYDPINDPFGTTQPCNTNDNNPGCGYDSLNVGTKTFSGAPYAGTDVAEGQAFESWNTGNYPNQNGSILHPLQLITVIQNSSDSVTTRTPLGQIITK